MAASPPERPTIIQWIGVSSFRQTHMEKVWKIWNDHVKMDDHGDIYRMIMGIFTGSVGPAKCADRAVAWKTSHSQAGL